MEDSSTPRPPSNGPPPGPPPGPPSGPPPITFQSQTIEQFCKIFFRNEKTKLSSDAVLLTTEMLRIYTLEIHHRASILADSEGSSSITPQHIEKILPQLLLDFT